MLRPISTAKAISLQLDPCDSNDGSSDKAADGHFGTQTLFTFETTKETRSSSEKHGAAPPQTVLCVAYPWDVKHEGTWNGQPDSVAQTLFYTNVHIHTCVHTCTRVPPLCIYARALRHADTPARGCNG